MFEMWYSVFLLNMLVIDYLLGIWKVIMVNIFIFCIMYKCDLI